MWSRRLRATTAAATLVLGAGCRRQDMYDQPRYDPLAPSEIFVNGASARVPPKGTVPRGDPRVDRAFHSGIDPAGGFVQTPPFPVDRALLRRGQERFAIFCSPCHGLTGDGNGMIVLRGFKRPASLHEDRLREQPIGYLVDVVTNGFGVMPSYASQVGASDRWAVAAYVRALQLSQNARIEDVPPGVAARLREVQ